jgi:hypothetical protein
MLAFAIDSPSVTMLAQLREKLAVTERHCIGVLLGLKDGIAVTIPVDPSAPPFQSNSTAADSHLIWALPTIIKFAE